MIMLIDNKLLLFGGKGGVGKTSCAAATALHAASRDIPYIVADVWNWNFKSLKFFEKLGFVEKTRFMDKFKGEEKIKVRLVKKV